MRFLQIAVGVVFLGLAACTRPPGVKGNSPSAVGEVVSYSFGTLDGELLTSQKFQGRVTVLLFGTSYDLATQAVSKRLNQLWHEHTPRINVALVLVEPPENADMARAYKDLMGLDYPVALADSDPSHVGGPFGPIRVIPSWVFLTRSGRVATSAVGDVSLRDLDRLVEAAERVR
jgi:hypothetical protein